MVFIPNVLAIVINYGTLHLKTKLKNKTKKTVLVTCSINCFTIAGMDNYYGQSRPTVKRRIRSFKHVFTLLKIPNGSLHPFPPISLTLVHTDMCELHCRLDNIK